LQKTMQMDPNIAGAHWDVAEVYVAKKMYPEAVAEWQKALTGEGDAAMSAALGEAYKTSGLPGAEQKLIEHCMKKRFPYCVAVYYAALGKRDDAINWLEKAYAERAGGMVFLKTDPALDSLHSDPRFQTLVRRMNFPQ
jgi:tetratricopeptide (TPR) repeat protein